LHVVDTRRQDVAWNPVIFSAIVILELADNKTVYPIGSTTTSEGGTAMMNTMLKTSAAIAGLTILFAGNAEATCSFNFTKVVLPKGQNVNLVVTCDNGEAFTSIDWTRDTTSASGGVGFPLVGAAQTGPFAYRTYDQLAVGVYSYSMTGVNAVGGGTTTVGPVSLTVTAPPVTTTTGACGTAYNILAHNAPTGNLCLAGTASAVTTAASAFSWTCTGSDAGNTACSAPHGYNVTPAATNGTITPASAQLVAYHGTKTFALAPATAGQGPVVTGTCGGVYSGTGNTNYTTQPVTADCTVSVNFAALAGATCGTDNGTVLNATPTNLCTSGTAGLVTTTASQYSWTCTGTGSPAPTANCAATRGYLVSTSAGANGTISPTSRAVASNGTTTFTVTPATNYGIQSVSSDHCGGSLSGTTYTTGAVTSACTVTASFVYTGTPLTDPGSGLWQPPGYTNLLVADQMTGGNGISYIPGCIDSGNPGASDAGCAYHDYYTITPGTTPVNFYFTPGNILSLRVKGNNDLYPGIGQFQLMGPTGANVNSSVSMWVVTDPTTTYANAPALCKNTAGNQPGVLTWSNPVQCPLTNGTQYYVNIMVNDVNHCLLPGQQCRFQFSRSTDAQ